MPIFTDKGKNNMVRLFVKDGEAVAISSDAKEISIIKTAIEVFGFTKFLNKCKYDGSIDEKDIYQYSYKYGDCKGRIAVVIHYAR